ncbi:MAG: glycosyltransferase family 2 protein [Candidatus Aenigmarchaeota archaeon]|nr:glycosyltransferase family 2 protein [Candidatus Aenigmarchaeota archaeon]
MLNFAIVPAYNEGRNIGKIVKQIIDAGLKPIVIDDCSVDDTYNVAKSAGAIVVRHDTNRGKGEALKTGLDYLIKNHKDFHNVILIDADGQYHAKESAKIIKEIENGADFVMGYRNWDKIPFRHRLGNFVWHNAFNILFGTNLKDTNCGFMGFNRKTSGIIQPYISGDYTVDNSMLIGALKNGLKIKQVPVDVTYHRKSKVVRGAGLVLDVLLYIIGEGLKYRFGGR